MQENDTYGKHVPGQLRQEPGEDVDSMCFDLANKQDIVVMGKRNLNSLREISCWRKSLPVITDQAELGKRYSVRRAVLPKGSEESNVNMLKDCNSKKPSTGFDKHSCYACGKVGHLAPDKIRPDRGKTCAKCGDKGNWAACCKSEASSKKGVRECGRVRDGRACGNKQRSSKDAKRDPKSRNRQVLRVGPELGDVANVFSVSSGIDGTEDNFPKMFSGVGKLSGYQLKLHNDPKVIPVTQKPRRIPYPLKEKVIRKINELLDLAIVEDVSGQQQLYSPPRRTNMMFVSV